MQSCRILPSSRTWMSVILSASITIPVSLDHSILHAKRGWRQEVRYQIEASLDTTAKQLCGNARIFYKNNSPDTLRKIYLQVPSNAFHDEENTAVQEMRRLSIEGGDIDVRERDDHKLTIESLQFLNIGELTGFPVQAFLFSDTILDLTLPHLLLPEDSLSLSVSFKQQFFRNPKDSARAQIPVDFVHWYPRVTVYDENGWHDEPFHFMMEPFDIYSEFAEMDVTLSVPRNYVVVASGTIVDGDPGWESVKIDSSGNATRSSKWNQTGGQERNEKTTTTAGVRRVRFRAAKIQNFSWSASPEFVYYPHEFRKPIHLFKRGTWQQHSLQEAITTLERVLTYLENHFGPYPFSHLSVIIAPERPTSVPMLARPDEVDDFTFSYELSSMFFPGTVATNGVNESWLTKGIQVYMGKSIMEDIYGKRGYDLQEAQEEMNWLEKQYPLPSLDALVRNFARLYMESGQNEQISKPIYKYKDPIGLLSNLYLKSEIFFEMLRFVVGDSVFQKSLREVVLRHQFSHITEDDLKVTFEDVAGQDLDWFFEQWLRDTPTVDYKKGQVRQYQREDETWITEVEIERQGDGVMPVDVQAEIAGKKIVKRWDGKAERGTVVFESDAKPKHLTLDPEDRIMDSNPLNNRPLRLQFKPDLPFLKFIHMPADAILVLWRPELGYNTHDSVRLGFRTSTSYRAFYHNLVLEGVVGVGSGELDGKISYSHPLSRQNLMNRYFVMARKNEGRFEVEAHVTLRGSNGILGQDGRGLEFGLNFSGLLNPVYTFRETANDTGKVRIDEWDDQDILLAYAQERWQYVFGSLKTEGRLRVETALPGGDSQFTKLSSRLQTQYRALGFTFRARGNLATAFGPDRLPLQDQFRAEGAAPRQRFHHDVDKTGNGLSSFDRRYVEGGGFLRGYAGQPLPAERYATLNFELGPSRNFFLFKFFGFFDTGRIWTRRDSPSFTRSDAGFGITAFEGLNLLGGNLSLFSGLSAKAYFPVWLSDPLLGEKQTQFRWYLSLGKGL